MVDPDPLLLSLWQRVDEDFSDERRHQALLDAARETGQLAFVATLYRRAAGDHERRQEAERRLTQITTLAFAQLQTMKTQRTETKRRARAVIVTVLGVVLLAFGLYALGWTI